ncbi:tetratricopeptide repeat protein [Phenylobacterium sp.]|uniref:tetratricopeptide repeat protein n=1 Tax=Phenylobacterium sp. TaxID=1871053 RepID=UPI0030F3AACB
MNEALRRALLLGAVISLSATGAAWSSGGGGGGGGEMPSASAPAYDPAAEYVKAIQALNDKKYKDAERALTHVVNALPKNAEAWRLLGTANAGQNDMKGARRAYEKAVKLEPDNIEAHRGLGMALGGLKDAKAQSELEWLKARAQACGTCADAPSIAAAVKAVETAIAGSATAASGSLLFAGPAAGDRAYVAAVSLINEHRYDEALTSLAAAREALGPHPDILTYQGYIWRKKGQFDRAETYYRQALAIAPEHRGATEYYGELKVERGDLAGARVMLARLDRICAYGCAEAEELRRWVDAGHEPST